MIPLSQNTPPRACLSPNRRMSKEIGTDVDYKKAVEASKTSAKTDEATRLKRKDNEASDLCGARAASLSPSLSSSDSPPQGLSNSVYDSPLSEKIATESICQHDLGRMTKLFGHESTTSMYNTPDEQEHEVATQFQQTTGMQQQQEATLQYEEKLTQQQRIQAEQKETFQAHHKQQKEKTWKKTRKRKNKKT